VKTNEPISLQICIMVNGAKGYFGGQEVKGPGRTRLNLDLEASRSIVIDLLQSSKFQDTLCFSSSFV